MLDFITYMNSYSPHTDTEYIIMKNKRTKGFDVIIDNKFQCGFLCLESAKEHCYLYEIDLLNEMDRS